MPPSGLTVPECNKQVLTIQVNAISRGGAMFLQNTINEMQNTISCGNDFAAVSVSPPFLFDPPLSPAWQCRTMED
jgi:hypothetical protein